MNRILQTLIAAAAIALPLAASAQNYAEMLRQSQIRANMLTAQINQSRNTMVQQKMQDPRVRAMYAQYVANMRARGLPAMSFPRYAEEYMATRGFTPGGIAYARAVNADMAARERASLQGLRAAQQGRAEAMRQQQQHYFNNRTESGRGLMGQSTYYGPNGFTTQLPHTWQNNTQHNYQGRTYRVTESGQYQVLGPNGWWTPINR